MSSSAAVRPNVISRGGIDQLSRDAHTVSSLAHTSFQNVAHAEFSGDLLHIDGSALVGESRVASDDEEPPQLRESRDDVFGHSVREVLLLRITAHVLQ